MRLANASNGFFVVPFWNPSGNAAELISEFEFVVSPLDRLDARKVKFAVIGLNLIQSLSRVRSEAVRLLSQWLEHYQT
jgi:hypothetical protein